MTIGRWMMRIELLPRAMAAAGFCCMPGLLAPASPRVAPPSFRHHLAAAGFAPHGLVAADFDGDGRGDLVVTCVDSDEIVVLAG